MLYIVLIVSLVLFFTVGSVMGVRQTKLLLETEMDEKARIQHYATITFSMWIPVIVVLVVVAFSNISFADIGFSLLSFNFDFTLTAAVLALAFLWIAFFLCKIIAFLISEKFRKRRNDALLKKASGSDYYDLVLSKIMTPRTKNEKRWWLGISLTTGICEEVIFRGVFIYLIASIFPNISIFLVLAIAVALFGLGHFYQGVKGLLLATLIGAFFALVYIVSDSLILVIAMHFITNFANAFEFSEGSCT